MRNITNELVDVAEWESVGIALGVSSTKLHEIRANRMNNGPLCKISMADTWLRSDVNASWEKLADALKKTGNDTQAEQVYQEYVQGKHLRDAMVTSIPAVLIPTTGIKVRSSGQAVNLETIKRSRRLFTLLDPPDSAHAPPTSGWRSRVKA